MNYKLCELLLEEVWNLIRIRTKYTFHSNRFCLFSCFPNILECCKCTRMRFHCAATHLEGSIDCKIALCWQQCCFFTHASFHTV